MTISYCNAIHSIKMEGRSGALHPARILVVIRTAHRSFSHTRIPSAYACGYPRSCSNFASLVFTYSDSSPWCRHSIKMEGRSGALHPARILVVVQTSHCSFSHTRIRHRGAAIPLKWNVVTDVGDGHFFALWGGGLCGRCPIITARLRVVQTFCTGQNYHLTRELV